MAEQEYTAEQASEVLGSSLYCKTVHICFNRTREEIIPCFLVSLVKTKWSHQMHVSFQSDFHAETAKLSADAGLPSEGYSQCDTGTRPTEDEKSTENGSYSALSWYLRHLRRSIQLSAISYQLYNGSYSMH